MEYARINSNGGFEMYTKRDLIGKIQKIYKQNNFERDILTNLANLFRIPIDISRLTDYQIGKIDMDELSLEVLDRKKETSTIATYSPYSEVLGFASPDNENLLNFIKVTSTSPLYKRESIYKTNEETPILERITIRNNEYGLIFERTKPNVIRVYSRQDGSKFLIKYFKEVKEENNKRNYELLSSIYKTNFLEKKYINFFQRLLIHDTPETLNKNRPDQFYFDINDNIIVGSRCRHEGYIIDGACFENIDNHSLCEALYTPLDKIKDYSNFDTDSVSFAVLYAGYSYPDRNTNTTYYHDLEITKTMDKLQGKYSVFTPGKINCILNDNFEILNFGNNPLEEVDTIIKTLYNKYTEDIFIQFIISELERFKEKLELKNGLVQEVINPLSKEVLINKTFDEIQDLVSTNKDEYFRLVKEQYDSIINNDKKENIAYLEKKNKSITTSKIC